jgi:hypothetical protein
MIILSHMISILNFVFSILFYVTKWTKQDLTCICFEEFFIKNHLNQISNFQQLKILSCFYFLFHFGPPTFLLLSFWPISYFSHNFLSVQSPGRPNHAFDPSTQFPLVIFDLQTPVATFSLLGRRVALRCVIRLWHSGAASPPPPLPLQKQSHPIASPSSFPSPIIGAIQVPPPLPPSLSAFAFRCPMAL